IKHSLFLIPAICPVRSAYRIPPTAWPSGLNRSIRNPMLTSRERVNNALNHQESDRVPVDLGASSVTGMQADTVYKLRQALGLDAPGTPVKVVEPYQMLGEIKADLMDAIGIDVVALGKSTTMFGFKNENWRPWTTFAGTP